MIQVKETEALDLLFTKSDTTNTATDVSQVSGGTALVPGSIITFLSEPKFIKKELTARNGKIVFTMWYVYLNGLCVEINNKAMSKLNAIAHDKSALALRITKYVNQYDERTNTTTFELEADPA